MALSIVTALVVKWDDSGGKVTFAGSDPVEAVVSGDTAQIKSMILGKWRLGKIEGAKDDAAAGKEAKDIALKEKKGLLTVVITGKHDLTPPTPVDS